MPKMKEPPLDEVQFRQPNVIAWWGGLNENTVHAYIRESPFFDHTSKNGLLWDQAQTDMRLWEVCTNRQAFETRLKQMNGVEYLIVGEPQKETDPALGPDTGIWVIRKQNRQRRPPREDEVTVLGTYYIVGENMYQAPSVYDIVGNHLLSAINSLSKFTETATPLPLFTPATGYTYYPPATSKSLAGAQSMTTQTSRETSLAPTNPQDPSQQNTTTLDPTPSKPTSGQNPRDQIALFESFNMMLHYGDEYMDENPLRGEPGNFTFSATKDRVRAKQAEAEAQKAKEIELARKLDEARLAAAATPFAGSVGGEKEKEVKIKKKDKLKKRRNKIAGSPSTPASPATPAS